MIKITHKLINYKSIPALAKKKYNQRGIALLQVLLITGVLSVLAIYLTLTAKNQVLMASWQNDQAQALVNLHSVESTVVFSLLTENKSLNAQIPKGSFEKNASSNQNQVLPNNTQVSHLWNFYGKPFQYNDTVSISIQDETGLIGLHAPAQSFMNRYLLSKGITEEQAKKFIDSLSDWQDIDTIQSLSGDEVGSPFGIRNGKIPSFTELLYIKGATENVLNALSATSTTATVYYFNPLNSPYKLFSQLFDEQLAIQLLALRNNRELSTSKFTELTGITQDSDLGVSFFTSNILSLKLKSKVNKSQVSKELKITINPIRKKWPISIRKVKI
jgi:general secretion pathway protein K